jgi:hypothetical protein
MGQPVAESFAGVLLEVAEDVVDAANVHAWVAARDLVRPPPARLVLPEPSALR